MAAGPFTNDIEAKTKAFGRFNAALTELQGSSEILNQVWENGIVRLRTDEISSFRSMIQKANEILEDIGCDLFHFDMILNDKVDKIKEIKK